MLLDSRQLALVQHLRRAPVFQGLERGHLDYLARHARLVSHGRGATIQSQDERPTHLRLCVNGRIDKRVFGQNGQDIVVRTFGPGGIFGHECLADDTTPTPCAHVAAEPSATIEITAAQAEPLLQDPRFARALHADLAREIQAMDRFIRRMLVCNLEARIAHYLRDHLTGDDILLPDSQPRIAAKVNASRTRVNITLQNWVKSGEIKVSRNRVTIQSEQFWKKYLVE
ncbi:Crp/Fnr family transcriptional regulator [Neogemmobacter tilapiae]|nr:Crp/Fnr family transcriptional regulator [Gemmobacter tilapiae]